MDIDWMKSHVIFPLEDSFNQKGKITPTKAAVFFDSIKDFPEHLCKKTVKQIIMESRYFPTPKQFLEVLAKVRENDHYAAQRKKETQTFERVDSELGAACRDYIKLVFGAWSHKPKLERYTLMRDWNKFMYRKAQTMVSERTSESELGEIKQEFRKEAFRLNDLVEVENGK